ncbi:RagB/SusD family nutrient uptake outer membrane protein [Lutibacter sp. A64]|uniref:RagB/SusD family nutrient uptake outer membrane protein n=1 Tax=Lutibacter sp. A64 TaxID=2918526 RepID=UPI001F05BB27|nr:RagB/SusD family nutrient uptake outer membrane protein [Lutibacter sp. A64]UMB54152.1 RagB/SusD family nutrient uptake outer membrane protein [Lutibacter sp. A64]
MKIYKLLIVFVLIFAASCSEDFVNNPPEDALTVDNFFNTDQQVLSSGSPMYGYPWFYFNEKFLISIGDLYSGNAIGSYSDLAQFENFSVNGANQFANEGWDSLYNVVANANVLMHNLETKVGADVSKEVIDQVMGEAYFMRASAYFYLVRIWGAIPIIHSVDQINSKEPVYRNRVEDIYAFIIKDYEKAYSLLPSQWDANNQGRATKSACDGMLAKVYLAQGDYTNTNIYTTKVINSGLYSLMTNYQDLFNPVYNNNIESIFALQWVACGDWGFQNVNQAYLAASPKLTQVGDGWGTFQPSIDLMNAYEDGDLRRYRTIMEPGSFYPELVTAEGGYTVPEDGLTSTIAGFRKYIVGSPDEGNVCFMSTDVNTNILRYADILLMHAESILANNTSTTDQNALDAYNAVRTRAGLDAKDEITAEDIFNERRIEFVVEGDYWFDLVRRDRVEALEIIANQERGVYQDRDINIIASKKVTPSESDFLLPIPSAETAKNPLLLEEPVAFEF